MNEQILSELKKITAEEKEILDGKREIDKTLYMNNNMNIVNSKKLLDEGKLISIRPNTRFIHFPRHTHDYIEVVYMCSGKTTHIINDETVVLGEGDLLFISENSSQEILPAEVDDIAVNFVVLDEFFYQTLSILGDEKSPLKNFLIDFFVNKNTNIPYLHFKVKDVLPIQNLMENLVWTLLNDVSNKRKINQTTFGLLILQLMNYTDRLENQAQTDRFVLSVLQYIEEHYVDGSLQNLSDTMHFDLAWMSREIKRRTGKTYTILVQEKRLSQSCFLLKNTHLSVDEISNRIGYDNISYFHRIFQKKYGITPRQYRLCTK